MNADEAIRNLFASKILGIDDVDCGEEPDARSEGQGRTSESPPERGVWIETFPVYGRLAGTESLDRDPLDYGRLRRLLEVLIDEICSVLEELHCSPRSASEDLDLKILQKCARCLTSF